MKFSVSTLLVGLFSFTSFAAVSIQEKEDRLKYLEILSTKSAMIKVDDYRRELAYQKLGLSPKQKARSEAQLLIQQVKTQLSSAYAETVKLGATHEKAVQELTAAIDNDLALAAPELSEELSKISHATLEELENGTIDNSEDLTNLETALLTRVKQRANFFEKESAVPKALMLPFQVEPKLDYRSKVELLEVLTSEGGNSPYVTSANISLDSGVVSSSDTTISLYVKLEFKGVYIDAGPSITFSREWSTYVSILAEGLNPILDKQGYFDFSIKRHGKAARRHMIFSCQAGLFFQTKMALTLGVGAGASTSVLLPVEAYGSIRAEQANATKYSNSVNLSSRQILLPAHIGTSPVTLEMLNRICHQDFLKARISNDMTVKGSLDIMMKNVVASLKFRHPKTKCTIDSHCFDWYNTLGLVRVNNYPRCILDEKKGEYAYCALRGLKGQTCAVYENGRRVSTDQFEFTCDGGLQCYKVREAGWFLEGLTGRLWSAPKGECH